MRLRPLVVVASLVLLAASALAQAPDTTRRAPGTTVSGVVRDSITHAPLAGAWVQLAAVDTQARLVRTVRADSLGRFSIDSVPAGRYALGFFHVPKSSVTSARIASGSKSPTMASSALPAP